MAPVMKLANKDCYGTTAHVLSMFKDEETMNIIRTKMGILIFFWRENRSLQKIYDWSKFIRLEIAGPESELRLPHLERSCSLSNMLFLPKANVQCFWMLMDSLLLTLMVSC